MQICQVNDADEGAKLLIVWQNCKPQSQVLEETGITGNNVNMES